MRGELSYETPNVSIIIYSVKDVIATSIVDNDGDFRDWETGGPEW